MLSLSFIRENPDAVRKADRVVLPGVGAFADCVTTLRSKQLDGPIVRQLCE